jgi:hypothetical protein
VNRSFTRAALAALLACAAAAGATAASEGAAPGWRQITHGLNGTRPMLGLARSKDGTLHVLGPGPNRAPWKAILDTPVSPQGVVGRPQPVLSGWDALHPPAAVTTPDGAVHAIASGQKVASPTDPFTGLNEIVGPAWKLGAKAFGNASVTEASNTDPRTAVLKDGRLITVWQTGLTTLYQVGTDPATPPGKFPKLESSPNVAVDQASGEAIASFTQVDNGIAAFQRIYPTLGSPQAFPQGKLEAPQIAARVGGGVYSAYTPDFAKVRLLRYGGRPASVPEPKGIQVSTAGVATGPEGRLWVFYANPQNTYVTRTNRSVSGFEPVQTFPSPPKTLTYFRLEGEGSAGALDLFADVLVDGAQKDGAYYRHVNALFGLALAKAPIRSRGKVTAVRVTVRVLDAGDGVVGAKVAGLPVGTKSTDVKGQIVFTVPAARHGTFRLVAAKAGYLNAKGTLTL